MCCLPILTPSFVSLSNLPPAAAPPVLWSGHSLVTQTTAQEHTQPQSIWPIWLLLHSLGCISVGTGRLEASSQETIPALSQDALRWGHQSRPVGAGDLWEGEGLQGRDRQWVGISNGHLGDMARLGVTHLYINTAQHCLAACLLKQE